MNLENGTQLGRYVVVAPIGAGGMGEVYKAHDEELDREVAIKVLPPEVADDADRLRRFTQEAQAAGGLNHPNVLTVHDIGTHEGVPYLVSELLEGESLRDRLAAGRIPPRKACEYAAQAARGLAAAHARGIVHRDLKPDNLYVTRDDRIKILDFGLAKLMEPSLAGGEDDRTVTMGDVTEPGAVLGTVGYMSPEQVRGETSDHRADIFALGTVLHEMLSGERAFQGEAKVSTLNSILVDDPPEASSIAPGVTKAHDEVVHHCLEKSPDHRFQSAQDLAFQLEVLSGATSSSSLSGSTVEAVETPSAPRRFPLALVLGALAVGALLGWAAGLFTTPEAEVTVTGPPRFRPITYSGRDHQAAISPDGRTLAFVSSRGGKARIWLKRLPGGDEAVLTEGPDISPKFSPDGSEILFVRQGDLYRVPILGGEPRRVVDNATGGDWTALGDRIAFVRSDDEGSSLHVMSADGSDERLVHREASRSILDVRWSPDATRLVAPYLQPGANVADPKILVVDVETGTSSTIGAPIGAGQPVALAWAGPGEILVYVQPVAQATLADQTVLVRHDLATDEARALLYVEGVSWGLDVVGEGKIALGIDSFRSNLQEATLGGLDTASRWLTLGDSFDRQPTYSPDGEWVAFSSNRAGNLDIWALELATGQVRRLTDHPGTDWDPFYTADGGHLVWSSDRDGHFEIWMATADGRNPRRISNDGYDAENGSITANGEWLVYNSAHPDKSGIWKQHLETGELVHLATGITGLPEISPDGQHVLLVRNALIGTGSVEVLSLEDGASVDYRIDCVMDAIAAGSIAAARSRWLPDGSGIAFLCEETVGDALRIGLFVQDFVPGRDTSATRRPLISIDGDRITESFGFSPDGASVMLSQLELRQSVVLAENLPGIERAKRRSE